MTRAAIYCRLSQDRHGPAVQMERQERESRAYAERHGWVVRDDLIFKDSNKSAFAEGVVRDDFEALLAAVAADLVDVVIVWSADRLTRRSVAMSRLLDLCVSRHLVLHTVAGGQYDLTDPHGRYQSRDAANRAEYESEQIRARTRAGKLDAASRGAWSGGRRMYGYRVRPPYERPPGTPALEVIEREREVVQDAAVRVLAGESLRSIALSLNTAGHRTVGGHEWTGSALRKVLIRPTTAGWRASGSELIAKGDWEPLIAEDLWLGVCGVLKDEGRRTTTQYARVYLGSGLYLCGVCGGPLTGNTTAGGGPGQRKAAYRCRSADRDGTSHVTRDAAALDDYVQRVIIGRLRQPDAVSAMFTPPADSLPLQVEVAHLRAKLAELETAWENDEVTTAQWTRMNRRHLDKIEELESRIAISARENVLASLLVDDLADTAWNELDLARRRAALSLLLTVTVHPRRSKGRLPGGSYFDLASITLDWKG